MKRLILALALASACFAQYVPTPRTLTDAEVGLILQTPVTSGGQTYAATGQYAIGFVVANPNGISPYTGASALPSTSILGMHGVGQQWALGNEHGGGYDLPTELAAYEAAEVAAGRGKLFVTSGGNPVYYDNSGFPYGKRPINVCDPRFVRFMANEQMRRRMLSPSNPGGAQSPQYPMLWQSWDEGFYLYSVYGFPGGTGDGSTWDAPFPQNQGQYTACVASYYAQLYAIAPDVFITLNQGSLAEANGTVNNNDLTLFQQIYNSSPNLNIDTENFLSPGTSTTETQTFFNRVQNITGWLSTTGRTAMYRGVIDGTAGQMQSNALAYLIAKEGNSFFSEGQNSLEIDPNNATYPWASIFDEMGTPTSAYSTIACTAGGSDYSNKVLERQYEGGIVYYNNCTSTQTITLPGGTWYDSTGTPQTSLTILSYASGVDSAVAQYVTNANYTVTPIVQPPQITPLGNGTITGSVTATITDGTSGATICYTTDGSMPTASAGTCIHGSTYSTALTISTTTTLTAIASHTGDANSWERATTFTITGTNPNVQTVVLNDATTPFFPLTYVALVLSNPSAAALTVNYTVTCDANITCSPSSGTATFAAFQTAIAVPVTVTLGPTTAADTMLFTVTSGTGYTVGAQSTYTLTVKRDFLPAVTNQYTEIHASSWGQGRSDLPTDNQNTGTTITAGVIPTTPATFRTAWKFDLSSVPSTATVTKATMLGFSPTNTDTGYAITAATCAAGVGTVTIGSNPLAIGQTVLITGSTSTGTGYNSTAGVVITATPSNQISYAIPSCTNTTWVSGGTVFTMLYPTSVYRATTGFTQSTVDWNNYFINGTVCSGGPCWAASPSATNYQTPGNSINGNTTGVLTITNSANHYDLTTDTQNIVNSTNPNNGWVMTSSESAAHRETFAWYTSAAANPPPESPSLLVQYNTPASCTITVTSPSVSTTYSGTSLLLNAVVGNCPNAWRVGFSINGESPIYVPVNGGNASYNWNTYYVFNNAYNSITATVYDATNTLLATSAAVSPFTVDNPLPEHISQFNFTVAPSTPVTGTWASTISITTAFTGSNAPTGNNMTLWVDGENAAPAGCSYTSLNTITGCLGKGGYENGMHTVVWSLRDTVNPLTNIQPVNWNEVAQQEYQITFANGAAGMEIRCPGCAEVFLVTGGPSNNCAGGSTCQLNAIVANTDGTTSALSSPTYTSSVPGCASVSSGGLLAVVGTQCSTQITITSGATLTSSRFWAFVNTANVMSHFGNDGSILTAYNPAKSIIANSIFQSCGLGITSTTGALSQGTGGLLDPSYPPQFSFPNDLWNNGWNICEASLYNNQAYPPPVQGSWQTAQTAYVSNLLTQLGSKLLVGLVGDSMTRGNANLFQTTQGIGSTYSPSAVQYTFNSWIGNRAIFAVMQDEVNSTNGYNPLGSGLIGSASGPTTVDCSTSPATVTWTGWDIQTGTSKFIITGSGDASLDYNTTTNLPALYTASSINANSFHFTCPTSSVYNVGSNPSLTIQKYVAATFPATGASWPTSSGTACPTGGGSGPCPGYNLNTAFSYIRTQQQLVSGYVASTYAPKADSGAVTTANWMGSSLSDFANVYTTSSTIYYLPNKYPLFDINHGDYFSSPRSLYGSYNPNTPLLMNPDGSDVQYVFGGSATGALSIPVASCAPTSSTEVCTLTPTASLPPLLTNVLPGITRGVLAGATTGNANYYLASSPAANTVSLYDAVNAFNLTLSGLTAGQATATISNGHTYTLSKVCSQCSGVTLGQGRMTITNGTDPTCAAYKEIGNTVTFSGTSITGSLFAGVTYYIVPQSPGACTNPDGIDFAQVPSFTSTGGTFAPIQSNNYVRGWSWPGPSGIEQGPEYQFATATGCWLLRCAGGRAYVFGGYWNVLGNSTNSVLFAPSSQGIQNSMHPRADNNQAIPAFHALSLPAQLITRLASLYLQPNLPSPDYGRFINCAAHTGTNGNLLMCQSYSQAPSITRTIDLTSIAVSGQATIKYCMSWQSLTVSTIAANTTSDTQTFTPDTCSFVAYVGTSVGASFITEPTVNVRLADVANATQVVVQYSYTAFPFTNPTLQSMMLPATANCSTGSCTIPMDLNIGQAGTRSMRILYLNSAGTVISVGDAQTF